MDCNSITVIALVQINQEHKEKMIGGLPATAYTNSITTLTLVV